MPTAVHQIVPNMRSGDAVGNTALLTRRILREAGYDSQIYCEQHSADLAGDVLPVQDYLHVSSPETVLLYHYSIGSETGRFVYHLPDITILIYHNITPPEYFLGIHDHVVGELYHGRKQLAQFAGRVAMAVGDSAYNQAELQQMGFAQTAVLPLAIDFEGLESEPDLFIRRAYNDFKLNMLFVGRIVPNKGLEDLVKLFAHFKKYISHDCRLLIVGDWNGFERYRGQLLRLISTIGLPDVVMTGRVDFSQLLAFYNVADAYVSMSRHEGFCVPLLEAMHFDVPVMARGAAAVPETMDGAGVVVNEMDFAQMAEILEMMTTEGLFRERLLEGQRQRLQRYRSIDFRGQLLDLINRVGGQQ